MSLAPDAASAIESTMVAAMNASRTSNMARSGWSLHAADRRVLGRRRYAAESANKPLRGIRLRLVAPLAQAARGARWLAAAVPGMDGRPPSSNGHATRAMRWPATRATEKLITGAERRA